MAMTVTMNDKVLFADKQQHYHYTAIKPSLAINSSAKSKGIRRAVIRKAENTEERCES